MNVPRLSWPSISDHGSAGFLLSPVSPRSRAFSHEDDRGAIGEKARRSPGVSLAKVGSPPATSSCLRLPARKCSASCLRSLAHVEQSLFAPPRKAHLKLGSAVRHCDSRGPPCRVLTSWRHCGPVAAGCSLSPCLRQALFPPPVLHHRLTTTRLRLTHAQQARAWQADNYRQRPGARTAERSCYLRADRMRQLVFDMRQKLHGS